MSEGRVADQDPTGGQAGGHGVRRPGRGRGRLSYCLSVWTPGGRGRIVGGGVFESAWSFGRLVGSGLVTCPGVWG